MLIPVVAILAAVTLLPVTLSAWGPRLDGHRIGRTSSTYSRGWARWGAFVVRHRIAAAITGIVIVAALALPALTMNTGQPDVAAYPRATPAAHALNRLTAQGVPDAVVFPVQILAHGGADASGRSSRSPT